MYTVTWVQSALDRLNAAHAAAGGVDRILIEDAVKSINARLTANAPREGVTRAAGGRMLMVWPVAVLFDSRGVNGSPRVLDCWLY